jgi:hypothetical protein
MATPELHHQVFGIGVYDSKKPEVFLCEGPSQAQKRPDDRILHVTVHPPFAKLAQLKD